MKNTQLRKLLPTHARLWQRLTVCGSSADRNAPTVLAGKKFTLTGAGGKAATAGCRKLLTTLLTVLKADVMTEGQTGIALNLEAWTEGRMILSEEQKTQLAKQAELFLEFIK